MGVYLYTFDYVWFPLCWMQSVPPLHPRVAYFMTTTNPQIHPTHWHRVAATPGEVCPSQWLYCSSCDGEDTVRKWQLYSTLPSLYTTPIDSYPPSFPQRYPIHSAATPSTLWGASVPSTLFSPPGFCFCFKPKSINQRNQVTVLDLTMLSACVYVCTCLCVKRDF